MNVYFTIERDHKNRYFELELDIEVDYDPGCPPIPCQDHDHPAFSDPGDPGHADIERVTVISCTDHTDDELPRMDWLQKGIELPKDIWLTSSEVNSVLEKAAEEFEEDVYEPDYEPDDYRDEPRDIND